MSIDAAATSTLELSEKSVSFSGSCESSPFCNGRSCRHCFRCRLALRLSPGIEQVGSDVLRDPSADINPAFFVDFGSRRAKLTRSFRQSSTNLDAQAFCASYHERGKRLRVATGEEMRSWLVGTLNMPQLLTAKRNNKAGSVISERTFRPALLSWSGELEAFAEESGVSPFAVTFRHHSLESALQPENENAPPHLRMCLGPVMPKEGAARIEPIFYRQYGGAESREIDGLQASWARSLGYALPEIPATRRGEILLCAREAVINAQEHGCRGRANGNIWFMMGYRGVDNSLVLLIRDDGPGIPFLSRGSADWSQGSFDRHISLGFSLMRSYADQLTITHRRREVRMTFILPPSLSK